MNMNGFLYYNGWTTSFIEDFVNDCEKCYSAGEVTCINYLLALLRDMLPDQRPYFAFWNKEGKLDVSVKLRRRLLSSFTLRCLCLLVDTTVLLREDSNPFSRFYYSLLKWRWRYRDESSHEHQQGFRYRLSVYLHPYRLYYVLMVSKLERKRTL